MTTNAHLWAIGYDDIARAEQVREEIEKLAWGKGRAGKYMFLYEIAVVVRHADGSFAINRKPFPSTATVVACTAVGFLAGLALAAPLTGATVGALLGGASAAALARKAGINDDFVQEIEMLMRPNTSALFVLEDVGDMEVILHAIHNLGGKVLKTNVNPEHSKLILSALAGTTTEQR
jgi:uncharacterized membrane protein